MDTYSNLHLMNTIPKVRPADLKACTLFVSPKLTGHVAPSGYALRWLTFLFHILGLNLAPVEDFDCNFVAREDMLRDFDLQR
jgi:hypothetical protein